MRDEDPRRERRGRNPVNTKRNGLILIALAAVAAGLWWLKRGRTAGTDAAAAAGTDATAKALSNGGSIGQVGSNFAENVTPEIVKLTLGYAADIARKNGPCWARSRDTDGNSRLWSLNSPEGNVLQKLWAIDGTLPSLGGYPVCF